MGLGVLLVGAIIAAYWGALHGAFLWDDDLHVTANPTIIGPLGLKEIWTTARANYFPLVLANFWLQHAAWGLNPLGYHIVTLACHALAALLLWRTLARLQVPGAWWGAALWALHPVQVESVAWICELKNTQSAVFFLAAALCWLHWLEAGRRFDATLPDAGRSKAAAETRRTLFYVLALLGALLAILSKPSAVMLPVALAFCAWWGRGRIAWRDLVPLAPFFALSALAAGWTIWEQKHHSGAIGPEWSQTLPERLAIAGRALWFYLGKIVWPEPLIFIYPRWDLAGTGVLVSWLAPLAALGAFALLIWRSRDGRLRPALFATAYFAALLFPVLGFFSVYFFRYSFVGDHFQYLASMGPLALAGAGVAQLRRRLALWVGGAVVVTFALLTARQTSAYTSNEALWRHTLARNPTAVMAWLNLGDTLAHAGRYEESMAAYRRGLELRPDDAPGWNDLGNLLVIVGRPAEAVPCFERSLALRPDSAETHSNLGNALHDIGRTEEALAHLRRALALAPDYGAAHNNLGVQLAAAGRHAEAASHFEAALRASPADAKTRDNLVRALHRQGTTLMAAGRWREASLAFQRAVQLSPDAAPLHAALAATLAQSDRLTEAVPVFERAIALDPRSAETRDNYGQVLAALGRRREAFDQMEEAARLRREAPR
jgi:tetratricopeptide (TPR) repeat protein